MDVQPTQLSFDPPTTGSLPVSQAAPAAGAAKAKRQSRIVRLSPDQLLDAADASHKCGERAAKRKVEGYEAKYLSLFIEDLSKWARQTEPMMNTATFAIDAQRVGRNLSLRRALVDRRTAAFRRAHARARGTLDNDDEDYDGIQQTLHDDTVPDATAAAVSQPQTADMDMDQAVTSPREQSQQDAQGTVMGVRQNLNTAAAAEDSETLVAAEQSSSLVGATRQVAQILDTDGATQGPQTQPMSAAASTAQRVAAKLDMEIDAADELAALSSSNSRQRAEENVRQDEDLDYEMELLREFEM